MTRRDRAVISIGILAMLTGCVSSRRAPLYKRPPQELGGVHGTIGLARNGAEGKTADVTECMIHRSVSKQGEQYSAEVLAAGGNYKLVVEPDPKISSLTVTGPGDPKTVLVPKSRCVEHAINFFQREGTLHGSVQLDCDTSEGHLKVSASFDNCGTPAAAGQITNTSTPISTDVTIR